VVLLHYHITTLQISNREPAIVLWAAGRRFGRLGQQVKNTLSRSIWDIAVPATGRRALRLDVVSRYCGIH